MLSSSFLALPVNLAISFITFKVIDPYYMGIWATMTIFETYARVLRLGVVNGMNRELPFAMGKGKRDKAIEIAQTALAYNIFSTVILWLIIPFLISNFELNSTYLICIGVNVVRVSLSYYTSYLGGTFRTTDNFNIFSNIQFVMIGVHLLLSPLIYFFKFNGYLLMYFLLALINAILLHRYRPLHVRPKFKLPAFKKLIKIGIPMFLSSYIVSLIDTLPRLFIVKYGSETLMGLFAPVVIIISTLTLLPNTLATYYYPKFSYHLGKTGKAKDLSKSILKIFGGSVLILIPMAIIGLLLIDKFGSFFPKYQDSIPYMKIALFIAPFTLGRMGGFLSIILKRLKYLAIYVLLYAFFQISSLFIIYYNYTKDVLLASVYSIVITYFLLFISSILLNYLVSFKEINKDR